MADRRSQRDQIEARLSEVTSYLPTDQEFEMILSLTETARKPFITFQPTGDDPATHFLPVVPVRKETTF